MLFPGEEDFGMIPLEVMSYGIPIIAYKKGGALETVVENKKEVSESSGIFFNQQNIESLQKALDNFNKIEENFNPSWIRKHAEKFEESKFLQSFCKPIDKLLKES